MVSGRSDPLVGRRLTRSTHGTLPVDGYGGSPPSIQRASPGRHRLFPTAPHGAPRVARRGFFAQAASRPDRHRRQARGHLQRHRRDQRAPVQGNGARVANGRQRRQAQTAHERERRVGWLGRRHHGRQHAHRRPRVAHDGGDARDRRGGEGRPRPGDGARGRRPGARRRVPEVRKACQQHDRAAVRVYLGGHACRARGGD